MTRSLLLAFFLFSASDAFAAPDLVVLSAVLTPEPGVPGEAMELITVVANQGNTAAGVSRLRGCEDVAPAFCTLDANVPALAAGARVTVRAALPANRTAGRAALRPRYFIARADVLGAVAESNETNNNRRSFAGFIIVPQVPSPPVVREEDERATLIDGVPITFSRHIYGPGGGPHEPLLGPFNKAVSTQDLAGTDVHAEVLAEATAAGSAGRIDVLIHGVRTQHRFPRLAKITPFEPRLSGDNGRIIAERMAAVTGVRRARRQAIQPLMNAVTQLGGTVGRFYGVGYSFTANIPVSALNGLSANSSIRSIESILVEPAFPNDEVDDARDLIGTDEFFDNGSTGAGLVFGLIDSGVRATHDLLSAPDNVGLHRDCVNGNSDCVDDGDPDFDPTDDCSHGTSTASILVGSSNLGSAYRGITDAIVDSFAVDSPNCTTRKGATLDAFERTIAWSNHVVVAELQFSGGHSGSVADAADDVFDSGGMVIAANGNYGPNSGTVRSPANAHKALGIGVYDVVTELGETYQSRGPTGDNRIKPDVTFPTNSVTGGDSSDADLDSFGGTSGATPYGAGTAAILLDESLSMGWADDPGRIYSMMIAFGDHQDPFDNLVGAGRTNVGLDADKWTRGLRSIVDGEADTIDFEVDADDTCVEAAIWWDESISHHNDIDLAIEDDNGVLRGGSIEVDSVFERVRINSPLPNPGTWQLRIDGYDVRNGASPQHVYYFVRVCD
jgi:hypothetical protein